MKIAFRIFAVLVVLGLFAAGGYSAYHAGVAQGVSQAPEVASAIENAAENGQSPMIFGNHGYGYGYPHHFGFNPFGGLCFSIFFLFLALGLVKMLFFRRMMWHGGHHYGHWGDKRSEMFEEWHKKSHEKKEGGEGK